MKKIAFVSIVWLLALVPLVAATKRYKVSEIYILGLENLNKSHIQGYLRENEILLGVKLSQKELERSAAGLGAIAQTDPSLLSLELLFTYVGEEVYIEVLVSEMSLSFIPGGANSYPNFSEAKRIRRKGQPPLNGGIFGWESGPQTLAQWDFSEFSRLRSNPFFGAGAYFQALARPKLGGGGLKAGLLYFYPVPEASSAGKVVDFSDAERLALRLASGLGPKLEKEATSKKLEFIGPKFILKMDSINSLATP